MASLAVMAASAAQVERTDDQDGPLPSDANREGRRSYDIFEKRPSIFGRRSSSHRRPSQPRRGSIILERTPSGRKRFWKFRLREWDENDEENWWFASTAIPLLAATLGPLANVLSIAALVTYWRMCLSPDADSTNASQCPYNGDPSSLVTQLAGQTYRDPRWCFNLNVVSLVAGFVGNIFLLFNFTNRIRYIIALPVTIIMWYIATGILIALTVSMEVYVPPVRPQQTYTQGFWYAVLAACVYMICSMLLMINMLGYFLGHYPQRFALTESQRTLILQTMLFFVWLAGGGAVFSRVESLYGTGGQDWSYVNALYFADVSILTVGFGDLYPTSNAGRGLVFPYIVGGIIMLGLMVSSITKFASELGSEKIIRRHAERNRMRTVSRTVTSSLELSEHQRPVLSDGNRPVISAPIPVPLEPRQKTIQIVDDADDAKPPRRTTTGFQSLRRVMSFNAQPARTRQPRLIVLRKEKDRFEVMRHIQEETNKFKRWYGLAMSILAFGLLWCCGAAIFWVCERYVQGMTYFEALYFCYVSLLTIGYGDLAPKSNPGRPFFVFWSLIAVPTMTILVSDLGETVIERFKRGTFQIADLTVLPKQGAWREIVERYPWLLRWLQQRKERKERERRLKEGFQLGPDPEEEPPPPTLDELAKEEPSNDELARKLPGMIRKVADDMKDTPGKRYTYEEWVEFTQLIRFSAQKEEDRITDDEEYGLIEWDWIGEDGPLMSKSSEAEFVLDRLCESMKRYIKQTTVLPPRQDDERKPLPSPPWRAGSEGGSPRTRSPRGKVRLDESESGSSRTQVPTQDERQVEVSDDNRTRPGRLDKSSSVA
ncbi:hypothetical protein BAUCODRAFT_24205 [Baudoinia panamericana UAMH 10762]|uniref:Potassium channel domain-containing protein n=1 Tax=Baudoinia panamericana (strain UAMH 10762) TaxID=717646 RepID=M2MIC9_BAUPA|nr:uncharacterized protein BAUCODRAFT_24205 [Baudoinia panamericana UAMH 10762]EMC96426.1 hypothetical protein BAUCODRAFT_24205 [Baudoinia panamericana UAMH 10762]